METIQEIPKTMIIPEEFNYCQSYFSQSNVDRGIIDYDVHVEDISRHHEDEVHESQEREEKIFPSLAGSLSLSSIVFFGGLFFVAVVVVANEQWIPLHR